MQNKIKKLELFRFFNSLNLRDKDSLKEVQTHYTVKANIWSLGKRRITPFPPLQRECLLRVGLIINNMNGVTKIHQATFFLKCTESQPNNLSDIEKVETKYEFVTESEKSSHDTEKSVVIRFCDCLFISTIVQINVVGFWRGLFGILSFFHNFSHLSILFFLGGLIQLQFTIWRECYKKHLWKKKFSHFLLRKLYTYTCASSAVFFWAGLWFILDKISSFEVRPPLVYSVVSYVLLVCFKFSNNLLASPLFITTDSTVDDYFNFDTAFKTTLKKKVSKKNMLSTICSFVPSYLSNVVGLNNVFDFHSIAKSLNSSKPEKQKYLVIITSWHFKTNQDFACTAF